jgi:hypothetical protein
MTSTPIPSNASDHSGRCPAAGERGRAGMLFAAAVVTAAAGLLALGTTSGLAADPPATRPATAPAAGTRPPAEADDASVGRLTTQLADPDWRTRERAVADLVRMGDAAVPALDRVVAATAVDEVRAAARGVLRQIAENKLIGTSYVTLHLNKVPPRRAFETLAAQAGTPLKAFPDEMWDQPGQPAVTLDVDRQPFWEAMRQLCKQTGVDLTVVDGRPRLTATGGTSRLAGRHAAVAGPFLVVPVTAALSRSVSYDVDDPPVAEDFSLQLLAFPEPKLTVLRVTQGLVLQEAVDEKGNSLVPEPPKAGGPQPAPGMDDVELATAATGDGSFMLHAQLRRPPQAGVRLARLRGTVKFQLQVESQTIEIRDPQRMKDAARTVNGTRVVFNTLRKDKDQGQYQLKLTAYANPAAAGGGWEDMEQSLQQRLKLLDDRGQALDAAGVEPTANPTDDKIEMTLTFAPSHRPEDNKQSGEPAVLVWDIPTKTRDVTVPFELRDLKLP